MTPSPPLEKIRKRFKLLTPLERQVMQIDNQKKHVTSLRRCSAGNAAPPIPTGGIQLAAAQFNIACTGDRNRSDVGGSFQGRLRWLAP
jgi:hypothetical protein